MKMRYEDAFWNSEISWSKLVEIASIPNKLYKYQYFYSENGKENLYWINNMLGEFHLSLASEFEDINDCRPFIEKMDVEKYLSNFFEHLNVEKQKIKLIINEFGIAFDENIKKEIVDNFQNKIRIGCFTDSYQNKKMWDKYSNHGQGFCIEYDTKKAELFSSSVLPVLYTSEPYNSSMNYAHSLIMECDRQAKKRSREEHLQIYSDIYSRIIKLTYIPIFLKDKKWSFENEYRMFIFKHNNIHNNKFRMEDVLNKNYNINLSKSITAIYLGENFAENEHADELYKSILNIQKSNDIKFNIYKMNKFGGAEKQG